MRIKSSQIQVYLWSQTNSCTGWDSPSAPKLLRQKEGSATARAAQQPSMLPPRRCHAVSALLRKRSVARICSGQRGQELASFGWPTSTLFAAEDNKTTSSVFPRQLRVCSDLALPRINECCPIPGGCPCNDGPVPLKGTHEGRVCGTLRDPDIARPPATTSNRQLVEILQIRRGRPCWHLVTFSIARRRVDGHTCSSVVTRKTAEQHNSERPPLNGKQLVRGATSCERNGLCSDLSERNPTQKLFYLCFSFVFKHQVKSHF